MRGIFAIAQLSCFISVKNKQMNEEYRTVNTCQCKQYHLAVFLCIFTVVNDAKTR